MTAAEFERRLDALAAARDLCADPATPPLESLEALLVAIDRLLELHETEKQKSQRRHT